MQRKRRRFRLVERHTLKLNCRLNQFGRGRSAIRRRIRRLLLSLLSGLRSDRIQLLLRFLLRLLLLRLLPLRLLQLTDLGSSLWLIGGILCSDSELLCLQLQLLD